MAEISIGQSSAYRGGGYWNWSVWIEATAKTLASIQHVVWLLHPTFPNPRVVVATPKTKFRLDSAGWGTFEVVAEVKPRTGRTFKLKHTLEFEEAAPAKSKAAAPKKPKREPFRVLLSFAAADSLAAQEVRTALETKGVRVLEAADAPPGSPIRATLKQTLENAHALVSLHNPQYPSRWVEAERAFAEKMSLPILTLDSASSPTQARRLLDEIERFVPTLSLKRGG